jgi:hypothetical protein
LLQHQAPSVDRKVCEKLEGFRAQIDFLLARAQATPRQIEHEAVEPQNLVGHLIHRRSSTGAAVAIVEYKPKIIISSLRRQDSGFPNAPPLSPTAPWDTNGLQSFRSVTGFQADVHGNAEGGAPMLQEIVLSVCMLIEPDHCKDVHVQVASELDASLQVALNCMRQAQTEGQKWIEGHAG